MDVLFDGLSTMISLIFLAILGAISGVAIPGLFLAALAPWLDWIVPMRSRRAEQAARSSNPAQRT